MIIINRKRVTTIVLSVLLVLTFTLVSTEQADAKSGKQTVYLPTETINTYSDSEGNTSKITTRYTYDKRGLEKERTSTTDEGISVTRYKRNSKGAPVKVKTYLDGKLIAKSKKKVNKKGLVTKSRDYVRENGRMVLNGITTYRYFRNKEPVESVFTSAADSDTRQTVTYRKDGTIRRYVATSPDGTYDYSYDKKGHRERCTYTNHDGKGSVTCKYVLDEHDNPTLMTETDKFINSDGSKTLTVRTTSYKYTYDEHGNILKSIYRYKSICDDGTNASDTSTITYKYKKVKVARKHLKYLKNEALL